MKNSTSAAQTNESSMKSSFRAVAPSVTPSVPPAGAGAAAAPKVPVVVDAFQRCETQDVRRRFDYTFNG